MPLAYSLFHLHKNYLVIRSGFEPETHSLEGCCSIQLSYQTSSECACRKNDACQRPWATAIPPLNPNSRSLG